jgi:hypothetical protein
MDVINQNSKEVTFKEFECAYKILNKIKRDNLTVKNAEVVIKTFEICYNFVLKIMEINPRIGGSLSYPENIQDASVFITELIRIFYN